MSSLNIGSTIENQQQATEEHRREQQQPSKKPIQWCILLLWITFTSVGAIGGPLMQRLYYLHGGTRKWLSSSMQTLAFPLMLLPLSALYSRSRASQKKNMQRSFFINRRLVMAGASLGLLTGVNGYMYSAGLAYIPVSTSSLLFSTQLAFTAVFSFVLVRQKFSFYSVNCVVLMTMGASILAMNAGGDRPHGVSRGRYLLGFFLTLGGAVLLGLSLPLIELCYRMVQEVTYSAALQFQVVSSFSATVFLLTGMAINKDFQAIPREAKAFGLGEAKYYTLLFCGAVLWQLLAMGTWGVIYCTSSLFAGILGVLLLPFTTIAAILAFGEKFSAEKGMSLALCLWGFTSYFIGEYKKSIKMAPAKTDQLPVMANPPAQIKSEQELYIE